MDCVYSVDSSEGAKLKKVVEANPFDRESFTYLGYTLKDSQALGLPAGKLALYFKTDDAALAAKLKAKLFVKAADKLKEIEAKGPLDEGKRAMIVKGLEDGEMKSVAEVTGEDREKIVKKIAEEQDSAAAGFGSIFG
ncbi:MAG: hypothetical protein NTY90_00585 [Candidatus Micrarchaeota archaeon]|nr:hypothetical protein [Candidatus Micrarchaeota archaeon]